VNRFFFTLSEEGGVPSSAYGAINETNNKSVKYVIPEEVVMMRFWLFWINARRRTNEPTGGEFKEW